LTGTMFPTGVKRNKAGSANGAWGKNTFKGKGEQTQGKGVVVCSNQRIDEHDKTRKVAMGGRE